MNNNIYIIGLPLSGKNNIGKLIKEYLKYDLININKLIEDTHSKSLYNLYNKIGHNTYLYYEFNTIKRLVSSEVNKIFIIPNTSLNNKTLQNILKETGKIIYVKIEFKEFISKYVNDNKYLLLNNDEDIYSIYKEYDNIFNNITKYSIYNLEKKKINLENIKKILEK